MIKIKRFDNSMNENGNNLVIISVGDMITNSDSYEEFINKMEELLTNKTVHIYNFINNEYDFYDILIGGSVRGMKINFNKLKEMAYHEYPAFKLGDIYIFASDKLVLKEMNREYREEDPYGEEDWGEDPEVNRMLNENNELIIELAKEYNLFNAEISFESGLEMINIANKLHTMGFEVFNYEKIINSHSIERWRKFIWDQFSSGTYGFVRTSSTTKFKKRPSYTYEEFNIKFKDIKTKKFKKIENPDDPFGEDDWGLEEVNELFNGGIELKKVLRDLKIKQYGDESGEVIFIKDYDKKKLKEKIINNRIKFYYNFDKGVDGIVPREKIQTIIGVKKNFLRTVFICEDGEFYIVNTDYPITIFPPSIRRFTKEDPYGEEDWSS